MSFENGFTFLKLPPELRNQIYRLLLVTDDISCGLLGGKVDEMHHTAIMRTCWQIHDESAPILYGDNTFLWLSRLGTFYLWPLPTCLLDSGEAPVSLRYKTMIRKVEVYGGLLDCIPRLLSDSLPNDTKDTGCEIPLLELSNISSPIFLFDPVHFFRQDISQDKMLAQLFSALGSKTDESVDATRKALAVSWEFRPNNRHLWNVTTMVQDRTRIPFIEVESKCRKSALPGYWGIHAIMANKMVEYAKMKHWPTIQSKIVSSTSSKTLPGEGDASGGSAALEAMERRAVTNLEYFQNRVRMARICHKRDSP